MGSRFQKCMRALQWLSKTMLIAERGWHALRQSQANEMLLWNRPDVCFVLRFTRVEAISGQRMASVGSARCMLRIAFYMLGQHHASELLMWDLPNTSFVLMFTAPMGNIRLTNCLCGMTNIHISSSFYRYWGNIRLTNCSVGSSRFIQSIVF